MEAKIRIRKWLVKLSLNLIQLPDKSVLGYSNRTADGQYVLFLDYDNYKQSWLVDEMKRLMDAYDLSHFFVFQSSEKSYHLVCIEKMNAKKFYEILRDSSADVAFKNVPNFTTYKSWILRMGDKGDTAPPQYLYLYSVPSKGRHAASNAHMLILKRMMDADIYKHNRRILASKCKFDKLTKVELIKYSTGSKILF